MDQCYADGSVGSDAFAGREYRVVFGFVAQVNQGWTKWRERSCLPNSSAVRAKYQLPREIPTYHFAEPQCDLSNDNGGRVREACVVLITVPLQCEEG